MFEEVRPFDWLMLSVAVLVVLLILFGVVRPMLAERKMRKRVSKTYAIASRGQALEHAAPADGFLIGCDAATIQTATQRWKSDVESWITDANRFLGTCSSQASAKFSDDSRLSHFSDTSNRFRPETKAIYEVINCRLSNLQEILQNPSVYLYDEQRSRRTNRIAKL